MSDQIDFRQVVHALSDALDLVGIDELQHGKRVAFMAVECGRAFGFTDKTLDRLYHAALLHDCGVSSTTVHHHLVSELDWAGSEDHCHRGHDLLIKHELFANLAPLIHHHHTHWEQLTDLDINNETALINNCIYLVDRVDALVAQQGIDELLFCKDEIRATINKYRGSFFASLLVDVFMDVSANEFFWLTLQPRHLNLYLAEMSLDSQVQQINQDCFLRIANMFANIVDAKSPFTVEHSHGVSRLAKHLGLLLELPKSSCDALEVAGLLHDLGKLRVPDEILEKPGPLNQKELAIMKQHSFDSYQILRRINGFESIAEMAALHHETISGEGYPFHRAGLKLSKEARIIAVADIFQALAQNRPYRTSMTGDKTMAILEEMAASNKLDQEIVQTVQKNFSSCWQAATNSADEG